MGSVVGQRGNASSWCAQFLRSLALMRHLLTIRKVRIVEVHGIRSDDGGGNRRVLMPDWERAELVAFVGANPEAVEDVLGKAGWWTSRSDA